MTSRCAIRARWVFTVCVESSRPSILDKTIILLIQPQFKSASVPKILKNIIQAFPHCIYLNGGQKEHDFIASKFPAFLDGECKHCNHYSKLQHSIPVASLQNCKFGFGMIVIFDIQINMIVCIHAILRSACSYCLPGLKCIMYDSDRLSGFRCVPSCVLVLGCDSARHWRAIEFVLLAALSMDMHDEVPQSHHIPPEHPTVSQIRHGFGGVFDERICHETGSSHNSLFPGDSERTDP